MKTSDIRIFLNNFTSTLRMLAEAPGGSCFEMRPGTGAFSTGLPFAGENYALFDKVATVEEICEVLDFYNRSALPFIALQLPELRNELTNVLLGRNIIQRTVYLAMSIKNLPGAGIKDPLVKKISSVSDAKKWTEAVWTGFEGKLPTPREYYEFSNYLLNRTENSLFMIEREGVPLCSALLHFTDCGCGLYYFATVPGARRQGLASRLMDALRKYASGHSERMVLLATETGAKMYKKYGFKGLLEVPVFSASDEI